MWSQPTAFLVTGATGGIGKAVAIEIAKRLTSENSILLVSSRTKVKLNDVQKEIKAVNPKVKVGLLELNLASPQDVAVHEGQLRATLKECGALVPIQNAVCIHNAASIGDMSKKVLQWTTAAEIQHELNTNIVSFLMINNAFWSVFQDSENKVAVNFTGGSAVKPLPSFGMPSMGKAARQIVLSIMTAESPEIKVLHFDPGLADTESLRVIRDKAHDESIRNWMADAYKGGVKDVSYIANFLIDTIDKSEFNSRDIIRCS